MPKRFVVLPVLAMLFSTGCTREELEQLGFGTYFVRLDKEEQAAAKTVSSIAGEIGFEPLHVYDKATKGFAVVLHDDWVPKVRNHPDVRWVKRDENVKRTPDEELPDDEEVITDPEPILGANEIPESIARIGGPYLGNVDLSNTHVAVIDTGIDSTHPDLNVVSDFDAVAEGGGKKAPGADPNGHGTHVAGTIGACADGDGVVGVAPCVPLHAVRVLDGNGSGYISDIVAGIEYVLEHPEIRVVNLSLGGPRGSGEDPMEEALQALEDAGVIVVVAAGNETQDTANVAPAGYDIGITVSAYDASGGTDNGYAWFSNFGDEVDVAAPGVSILSTWPGGGYAELDGTSMATPAVAGSAAVYMALNPNAGPTKVRNAMVDTSEGNLKSAGGRHPEGMVDVEAFWK